MKSEINPQESAGHSCSNHELLSVASMGANWTALRQKVGDELCAHFTFMASYPASGQVVHTYKHHETRRYLNIDETGQCYAYKQGGYAPITDEEAFTHVFG